MHKIPSNNRTLRTAHKEHGRAATHPEKGHGCLGEQRRLLYAGLWRKSSTSSARFRVTHMATASSATPQLPSSTSVTRPNSVLGNNNVQSFTQAQKRSSNRNRSACRREGQRRRRDVPRSPLPFCRRHLCAAPAPGHGELPASCCPLVSSTVLVKHLRAVVWTKLVRSWAPLLPLRNDMPYVPVVKSLVGFQCDTDSVAMTFIA